MCLERRRDLVIKKKENNNTNFISQNCGITNYYITIILHIKNKYLSAIVTPMCN
jgi:hypothetical protein